MGSTAAHKNRTFVTLMANIVIPHAHHRLTASSLEPRAPSFSRHASSNASHDEPTIITVFPASTSRLSPSRVSLSLQPSNAMSAQTVGSTYPIGGDLGVDPSASRHRPNAISSIVGLAGSECGASCNGRSGGCAAARLALDPLVIISASINTPRSGSRDVARTPLANSTLAVSGSCDSGGGSAPSGRASTTSTRAAGSRSRRARRAACPAIP